jgi:UDP-3-O-[3-hydroxymyristoyl] glucosamine N-acyltransferase
VRLAELAAALALPFEGDGALELDGLAGLDDAGARELSFATGTKYRAQFEASRAGAFLLPPDFDALGRPCLRSPAPYADFARAVELFLPRPVPAPGVHPTAVVAPDARLGPDVWIGPLAVVGAGAVLGARVRIHPHATVYPGVEIGDDSEIHSGAHVREGSKLGKRVLVNNGAVIGSPGFGFVSRADGTRLRVPHACPVEIGDDCEIGANTTIDASHPGHARRGHAAVRTRLGADVKIDNQVQVGHGCEIGDHSTLCAHVGLAGSTVIGKFVYMGGKSASAGHLTIGDFTLVGALSATSGDLAPGSQVLGVPSMERRLFAKVVAATKRLPDLFQRVRRIERKLGVEREE